MLSIAHTLRHLIIAIVIASSVVVVTSCTTTSSTARQLPQTSNYSIPTPIGAAFRSSLPEPAPTTEAIAQVFHYLETSPVTVGHMSLVEPPLPTPVPRYTVLETKRDGNKLSTYVVDSITGAEVQLGEPGTAFVKTRSERYIIWGQACLGCALPTGLYAYDVTSGETILIFPRGSGSTDPEIAGDWVVYHDFNNETRVGKIHVHHLGTGEDVVIEDVLHTWNHITSNIPVMPSDVYDIWGTQVVWEEDDILRVYDVTTQITRSLDLPSVTTDKTRYVVIAEHVVLWRSYYGWWGYDLTTDGLFKLYLGPPGWERLGGGLRDKPTMRDGQLYWSFSIGMQDGSHQQFYLTAPLIRTK